MAIKEREISLELIPSPKMCLNIVKGLAEGVERRAQGRLPGLWPNPVPSNAPAHKPQDPAPEHNSFCEVLHIKQYHTSDIVLRVHDFKNETSLLLTARMKGNTQIRLQSTGRKGKCTGS